jgi:ATP-dependent DNA helicase DinG
LYCASDLPDPRHAEFGDLARGELLDLIKAAGGRTLALFTSRASMQEAIDVLSPKLAEKGINLLGQDDMSKDALIRVFSEDETSCLFATMSFWQGVDVPGPACSLVVIDKLPFKPPDNPVSQARRELALSQGLNPFITIDLPHCAILLAQGMGRLLRSKQDRGVVAVLDRRLVESSYSKPLLSSLPPLPLTCDKAGVIAFLNDVCAGYSPVNNRK